MSRVDSGDDGAYLQLVNIAILRRCHLSADFERHKTRRAGYDALIPSRSVGGFGLIYPSTDNGHQRQLQNSMLRPISRPAVGCFEKATRFTDRAADSTCNLEIAGAQLRALISGDGESPARAPR